MFNDNMLRFYSDKECKNEILGLNFDGVTLAGGESKPLVIWIKNISGYELQNIEVRFEASDINIDPSNIPTMMPDDVKPIVLIWKPKIIRSEPLKSAFVVSCIMIKRA